jgi:hypothetical protein
MVYDEGFNMDFDELSFFAFSNYIIQTGEDGTRTYKSKCYSTCVGWYRNKDGSQWGCYRAFKLGKNPELVTYTTATGSKETSVVEKKNAVLIANRVEENIIENSNRSGQSKLRYASFIDPNLRVNKNPLMKSFLSVKEQDTLKIMDSSFNQHHLYVRKLNKISKNWHAEVHDDFKFLSFKELNKRAGFPRSTQFRFSRKKAILSQDIK